MQREYLLRIRINDRSLNRVVIDSHYEVKHSSTINDPLILELVKMLNGRTFEFESTTKTGWEIYVNNGLYFAGKFYRLIWCLHLDENYLGVINVFRRKNG